MRRVRVATMDILPTPTSEVPLQNEQLPYTDLSLLAADRETFPDVGHLLHRPFMRNYCYSATVGLPQNMKNDHQKGWDSLARSKTPTLRLGVVSAVRLRNALHGWFNVGVSCQSNSILILFPPSFPRRTVDTRIDY